MDAVGTIFTDFFKEILDLIDSIEMELIVFEKIAEIWVIVEWTTLFPNPKVSFFEWKSGPKSGPKIG